MADDDAKAEVKDAATEPDPFVDDELHAVDGLRSNAQRVASALGAIPGLAVLSSLIRAPGDAGFEPWKIVVGVLLAALGAVLGVKAFSDVMKPAELGDDDLENFEMGRLSGNPFPTYTELADSTRDFSAANEVAKATVNELEADAKEFEAQAVAAEEVAKNAEAALANDKENKNLQVFAKQARAASAAARAVAGAKAGAAAAAQVRLRLKEAQLAARRRLRTDAMRLQAATDVRKRIDAAWPLAYASVACIAVAVILLALAPKPEAEAPAAQELSLVSISLTEAGRAVLGCDIGTVEAIQIGGTTEAPVVVTMPVDGCASKIIKFPAVTKTNLGDVTIIEPVTSNPTPTPGPTPTP